MGYALVRKIEMVQDWRKYFMLKNPHWNLTKIVVFFIVNHDPSFDSHVCTGYFSSVSSQKPLQEDRGTIILAEQLEAVFKNI